MSLVIEETRDYMKYGTCRPETLVLKLCSHGRLEHGDKIHSYS